MIYSKLKNLIFYLLLFFINHVYSQQFRYGVPLHHVFKPSEYEGHSQIWSIDQLPNGVLVMGTTKGILFYNGSDFKNIYKNYIIRIVRVSSNKKIYVGGESNFGYLKMDSIGNYKYVCLSDSLKGDSTKFETITNIYVSGDTTLFSVFDKTFLFVKDTLVRIIKYPYSFGLVNVLGKDIYVFERPGLYKLNRKKSKYNLIKNSKKIFFSGLQGVTNYYGDTLLLIGYNSKKFRLYKYSLLADTFIRVKSSIDSLLDKHVPVIVYKLKDNRYFIGIVGYGIVILNSDFSVYSIFDTNSGLPDTYINWIYEDNNGNIWVATNLGFLVIYYNTYIYRYPIEKLGINTLLTGVKVLSPDKLVLGSISSINRIKLNKTLSSTSHYVVDFRYKNTISINLENVPENEVLSTSIKPPVCVGYDYFYRLDSIEGSYFVPSIKNKDIYYLVGAFSNFGVLERENGKWKVKGVIKYPYSITSLFSIDFNKLVGSTENKIFSLVYDTLDFHMKNEKILLDLKNVEKYNMFTLNDTLFLLLKNKKRADINTFYYDNKKDTFLRAPFNFSCIDYRKNNSDVNKLFELSIKNIISDSTYFVATKFEMGKISLLEVKNHKFIIDDRIFYSIKGRTLYPTYDKLHNIYWFASGDAIYNIPSNIKFSKQSFKAYVNSIIIGKDSALFFNGDAYRVELPYKYNSLEFNFVSTYYIRNKDVKYSYKLLPLDVNWSEYSTNNYTRYTNLPPGDYVFSLKAKNIFGDESNIYEYSFSILPPWYMTWWAYLLYVIFIGFLIYSIVRYYTYRLKLKNIVLERIVEERTMEIKNKNEQLLQKNEEIQHHIEEISHKNKELFKKNKQITESIEYAKKIQEAIIPNENELKKIFLKSFVLFSPRDIVSGDFFWVYKMNEQEKIIALADCTGHGVPGAFMSMIGNTLLNKIVKEDGIYEPSQILYFLHNGVIKALQEGEEDKVVTEDGMDVIVCKIDERNKKLVVASANQTGFFYIDGKFIQVYGDPFAIGDPFARQEQIDFSSSEFEYKKEAMLYFTSDGYYDQFGGEGGNKKFTMKRFIELLDRIKDYDVEKQRQELGKVLDEWKSSTMQLDDILVIGIKL